MNALDPNIVRQLVRDAVREAVAELTFRQTERVTITNDAELRRFVARLVELMDDAETAARLRSGAIAFELASGATVPGVASPSEPKALSGIVGEKILNAAPRDSRLVLAAGAVVTPVARDRAGERRITLVRSEPC